MKKLLTFLFAILFAAPCFATGVSGDSATCDSGTLSTDTGPTNLRANYESNVLNLKWHDENGTPITTNTCTYGGTITMPTAPTKRGYTFKGWKVIPKYDFTTLDINKNGRHRYVKRMSSLCMEDGTIVTCDVNFSDLSRMDWKVLFDYGMIYGMSKCTNVGGTNYTAGDPGREDGKYCWCKAKWYKQTSDDTFYESSSVLSWIYLYSLSEKNNCENYCADACAAYIQAHIDFRRAVFGISNN